MLVTYYDFLIVTILVTRITPGLDSEYELA